MKIFTPAARASKKLLDFVVEICSSKKQNKRWNTKTNIIMLGAECNNITANTNNNPDDAKLSDASFSFSPNTSCHAEFIEASSLKISFMKSLLHCLQSTMNFFISLSKAFREGCFKEGIFNNKNKYRELQMVPVSLYHPTVLPFNQKAMRSFLPAKQPKNFMKILLRKSRVFAFAFVFAGLFFMNNSFGQFPVIAGTSTSFAGGNLTTQTVSLPSGVQTGDLLIVIMGFRDRTFTTTTVTFPTGWTELVTRTAGTAQGVVFYKVATATEAGASSISVSTGSVDARCAHIVYRIQNGTYTGTPQASFINAASMVPTATNPNPPSLTPTGGSGDFLWIAGAAGTRAGTTPNTSTFIPTNFSGGIYSFDSDNTTTSSGSASTATRQFTGTTLDPGTFTLTTTIHRAFTIAIRGATPCTTPTAFSVTGGGSYCSGGSGVAIGLSNSETGITYQLYNGVSTVGSAVSGTGSAISFGNKTTVGTYSVVATRTSGGCSNNMTGSVDVVVTTPPTATGVTICQGGSGSLTSSFVCPDGSTLNSAKNAGTATSSGSGTAWSGLTNITDDDGLVATYSLSSGGGTSQILNATNFGFTDADIPTNANISAITVSINRYRSGGSFGDITDNSVRLLKAGTAVGDNDAASGNWSTTTSTVVDYIGSTNTLWNTTWAPTDIKASNFGVALVVNNTWNRTANVDYIQITVYYTIPGSLDWYTASSGGTIVQSGSSFNPVNDPQVIAAGGIYANLANTNTSGTYPFWVECANSPGCRTAVNFVINASIGGTATATATSICTGSNTAITLTGYTGSIQWQQSPDGSTGWANVTGGSGATTATYTTPNLTATTYYRAVVTSGTCGSANSSSAQVTINLTAAITSVTGTPPTLCIGGTATATATGVVLGGGTGTWSHTGGITIDGSGNVTAVTPGPATITYTISGGCGGTVSASKSLFVLPNSSVASVTGTSPLCVGATATYTANGQVQSGGAGAWSSSNTAVATVDGFGTVTAAGPGTANIIFTISGGCNGPASAQQSLTVNAAPQITTQPSAQTVTYGAASVSFSVAATVDTYIPAPTYQWQVNTGAGFNNIFGETSSTLTIANPPIAMSGYSYQVILTNSCGSTTSSNVSLTVNPLPVTVTANAGQAKVYGDADPAAYTYTSSPAVGSSLANGDVISFTGALSRASGEAVGTAYAIGQNSLANSNYSITYNTDNFAITPLTVTVNANTGQSKIYGDADPASYTYTSVPAVGSSLANGEVISFTGALSRASGEAVGTTYAIGQNDLANSNYNIIYNAADFAITPLTVTVNANAGQSKIYGDADPAAYTYTSSPAVGSSLANGDVIAFTGALNRASGEAVGTYAIGQNDLTNSNYNIVYNADDFSIAQLVVIVTADAGQSKIYGDADPAAYTYTSSPAVGSSLANGDVIVFTGALNRTSGEAVSTTYAIGQNSLANSNYSITYTADNFAITPLTVTVTANAGQSKVYGDTDPAAYTYTSSPAVGSSLANGDVISFTGTLSRASGEAVATYAIGQNNLANSNYSITYNADNFAITPLTVTVTADAGQTKVYGDADPAAYTYTSSPAVGSSLANGEVISFTGALSRASGEAAGTYAIGQNDLTNSNYNPINYTGANFTITNIPISASASAGIVECVGGTTTLTVTATGGDGTLSYSIDGGANYQASNLFTVNAANSPYVVTVKDADGFTVNTNSVIVTEQPTPTINLTSGAESSGQTICIGNAITDINYSIGGNTTGATVTALPSGLTSSFSGGVFTITGTPAAPGVYPYTVTTTGPCVNVSLSGTITVNDNSTISLSSASGTDGQTFCINTAIDNITYSIGGGATGATVGGLPNGLTGIYNAGVFTISGTPTVSGIFNYTVTTTGPCDNPIVGGTITVNGNSSISLSSSVESTLQTVCINNAIATITYDIDDGATGGGVTGLPNGVTGTYNAGVFTITGTPTESGTFNYTVLTEGPCNNLSLGGTIIVNANSTISLSSASGTDGQTVCINNAIGVISYAIDGGATGALITAGALPDGVTGSYSGGAFTIIGTPTESGTFSYTVTTAGPCVNLSLSGTITVNANSTISLSSGTGTDGQTVCINNAISGITYSIGGGGTSASITAGALPNGVTGSYSGGVFTIAGTPTQSGVFNYTVSTTGPCINVSLSGTITVNADATISLTSGTGSKAQAVCLNNQINSITYSVGGSGTGATLSGSLPNGVTGSFSGGVYTISGIPTQSGVFSYSITTTGPCVNPVANGTITINPLPVVNPVANATYCDNGSGAAIIFSSSTPGTATYNWSSSADIGFGTTGVGNIPAFNANNNSNGVVTATISVTATINGCTGTATTFNITVNPTPVVNPVSNLIYCNNAPGAAINFSSPVSGGTVTYTWASSVNIGFGLNGNGNIGAFTAINNSINPITTTVTVTPSLNGCTGSPITFTLTVNPNANAGTISGSATICTGSVSQLSTNGSLEGTWTSTNPAIASVDPSTGNVTGVATGSTTIFYTVSNICGASSASFTVSVNPNAVAGAISGPATICAGSSTLLISSGNSGGTWYTVSSNITISPAGMITGLSAGTATVYYYVLNNCGFDVSLPYNVTVVAASNPGVIIGPASVCTGAVNLFFTNGTPGGTWASSNTSVANIGTTTGFALAISPGTTTLSYTVAANSCSSGSQTSYFTLTVNPGGNPGIISGLSTICAGTSTTLNTTGSSGGTWSSGNTSVATVNPGTGMVTGVAPGNVVITYYISNTCGTGTSTFTMNVSPGANAGAISGPSSVCVGSPTSLTTNGTPGGSWSSSNTSVAIVDSYGQVVGQGAGSAIITYSVTSACATSSTSTNIMVNALPNPGTVTGSSAVCAGLSTTFTSNGNSGGVWSSSNPAAASVNSASGVVTGVAAGNATITYSVTTVCGTASQSANITVNPVLNAGAISGGSTVCMGSTINLSSTGNSSGTWSSSNTAVATVDASSGVVTSVTPGNTTITYTVANGCGTSTATQLITVTALVNAGTLSGASSICADASTTYSSNGTSGGTWSSSNTAVVTVDAGSGVVTGVSAGTATITYMVTNSCGTKSATHSITVNPLASAGTISGANAVCVGHPTNLTSNISGGTWGSNSPSIATVNSSGQVSGVAAGIATITYTISTSCGSSVATYPVAVNSVPFAGTVTGTSPICVGSSAFYTDMGGAVGGVWKSTKPAVATVDPVTGEVTAISSGNTVIVYTVTNSCGSSNAAQTVFVNSLPNAGTVSGLSSVCAGANINLSANGDAGGTWTSNNTLVATVNATTGVVTGVAEGSATIIYTVGSMAVCGTSSATHLVTVNPLANAGTLSGTTTVCTGLSTTLTSNGSVGGTWNSSNPAVASVNSTSGVVTAIAAGTTIINYTVTNICGSATASATVTVNPVPNAGTISGATSVCIGSTINLSSNVSGGTWSSSANAVATIGTNTGIVTGIAPGNTTITYTITTSCGTATTNYAITVNPLPNAGTISGTTYLCTGSTTTLSSNMSGGTWSSSNTSAATVNSATGVVTGVSAGSSTIIYTVSSVCGTATASAIVTIGNLPNAGTVSGAAALCVSSTAIFTSNGTGGGSWSSNNTAAATVDATTGLVTGVAAGSATISYTVSSTCGSSVSSANITISALPNAGLVSGSSAVCAGSITTLTTNGTGGGIWSSNNNLVASVNSSTGVVTGVGAGSATITYTVTNTCGTASTTAGITVNALPNSGTVSGATTLCAGVTTAFTSTGNGGGSWSSNNTAAATVDPVTGAVTGVAAGSATISYTVSAGTCGSSTASANITINPSPNPGSITGSSTVCAGAATNYTSNGMINGSWSSNNTAVATVDAGTGVVTGVSAGTTTITYTVTNGCGTAVATQVITVNPLANAGSINGASTVCVSSTTAYTSDGLGGGTWTSSDPLIATVNSGSGLVTGVLPGNATITYTVTTPCGTATASAAITVIILPNAGTVSGAATVCAGSSTTYTSDGLSGGTWSSVTPLVATVDANTGVVTGVSAGNATIVYTFTNGCGTSTASQQITVNPLSNAGIVSGAATVCIGAQATFTSTGLTGGSWSSDNTAVATVNSSTGAVLGIAAGSATITYTSITPCGNTTASSGITVIPIPDAGTVSGSTTVCVGATTLYTSSGMSGGTWSSVTPSVAIVDANTGVVTGVSAGNATITYTFTNACGTTSASQMILVNPLPNAGTVSGASAVCAGSQATFTTNGLSGGLWSSNNTAAATVDINTGVVMGIAAGNATITYTSTTPCGMATATANITVNPVVNAGTVSGASTLCIGSTTPYTSSGSAGGTWSSVTPSVATVNSTTGVVTGVSTGNATITYTVNGCGVSSASQLIAVSMAANPGTINGPSSVCAGSSVTFTRSGGSSGGTWSSSNTSVATVSGTGNVTGISAGTAVISYSITSGCGTFSATKSITVSQAPTLVATNITASTDLNDCSALLTLGSNITTTGSPTTLEYRIGFLWFSYPISSTHRFYRGTTPVTVRATNSCGSIMRLFLVTVNDNQPPTITCKPGAVKTTNNSKYSVHGHEFDATASDGCGVASLIYSLSGATNDNFDWNNRSLSNVKLNIGTTTITWKATDVNGNVSTCTTVVTVNNNNNFRSSDPGTPAIPSNSNPKLGMLNAKPLTVKVAPNPTSFYFTLGFQSGSNEKMKLIVTDVTGRIIEQRSDVPANSTMQLGSRYHFGVYFAEIVQGKERIKLRLIKGRD